MTAEKFFVSRHPEFQRRISQSLREQDKTDYDSIIGITPYKSPRHSGEDYKTREPPKADEIVKYDHSITKRSFEEAVPDIILDVIEIAVATFAADKAVDREINIQDDVDESKLETRNIKLQIPVLSSEIASSEIEDLYSEMVSHMTRDLIEFEFLHIEPSQSVELYDSATTMDAVSLLSDGLDSAGGVYYNKSKGINSDYVTVNYGRGVGSKAENIAEETGIDQKTYRIQYKGKGESTQFSRGLLHLSFAVADATAEGADLVQSFENGIMRRIDILGSADVVLDESIHRILIAVFVLQIPIEECTDGISSEN